MSNNKIILPRTTTEGKPRISYSQITAWNEKESFNKLNKNTTISGSTGYILRYFLDYDFPPSVMDIYAPFGLKAEDYICQKLKADFDEEEMSILDRITPIGEFQQLVEIDFGDFVLEGFIDDTNEDRSIIRDYKTASRASAKKYEKADYFQLDVYALDFYKKFKRMPKQIEVCVIERAGSHFKPPLKVKDVFYIQRPISIERFNYVEQLIIQTVKEISDCYTLFKEIEKL